MYPQWKPLNPLCSWSWSAYGRGTTDPTMQRHIKGTPEFSANSDFQLTNSTLKVISVVTAGEVVPCYGLHINLLKTKCNLLYIRNQFVPRSKHFLPRL